MKPRLDGGLYFERYSHTLVSLAFISGSSPTRMIERIPSLTISSDHLSFKYERSQSLTSSSVRGQYPGARSTGNATGIDSGATVAIVSAEDIIANERRMRYEERTMIAYEYKHNYSIFYVYTANVLCGW